MIGAPCPSKGPWNDEPVWCQLTDGHDVFGVPHAADVGQGRARQTVTWE